MHFPIHGKQNAGNIVQWLEETAERSVCHWKGARTSISYGTYGAESHVRAEIHSV